jgi:hypothetical protein
MKRTASCLAVLAIAACSPTVPESGPAGGVGFGDYSSYSSTRIERERLLRGQTTVLPPSAVTSGPIQSVGAPLSATAAPAVTSPVTTGPATANNPGISDEQSFDAVSARESIESDAERLARLREEYRVIEPEALAPRAGGTGPNIVAFALSTTNQVGEQVYRRSNFNADSRFQRACARFATADEAQREFLARGGPESDRMGVDPDGDGFACYWDPRPFRAARGG